MEKHFWLDYLEGLATFYFFILYYAAAAYCVRRFYCITLMEVEYIWCGQVLDGAPTRPQEHREGNILMLHNPVVESSWAPTVLREE